MSDHSQDEDEEKLQYVKKDLLPPKSVGKPNERNSGGGQLDDDSNHLFMSEPSVSEADSSEVRFRLLSPAGSLTEDDEGRGPQGAAHPMPSQNNRLYTLSPGNTSLSSWESPHVGNEVKFHFSPDRPERKSDTSAPARSIPTADVQRTSARQGPASQPRFEQPTENRQRMMRSVSSGMSDGQVEKLGTFLDDLRETSAGRVEEANGDATGSFGSSYRGPEKHNMNGIYRRTPPSYFYSNNRTSQQYEHHGDMDPGGTMSDASTSIPFPSLANQSLNVPGDDTIVMTLSASDDEDEYFYNEPEQVGLRASESGKETPVTDSGADDEQTAVRPKRVRKRHSDGSSRRHRRQRSGDAAAVSFLNGEKDWKGMERDQIPLPVGDTTDDDDSNVHETIEAKPPFRSQTRNTSNETVPVDNRMQKSHESESLQARHVAYQPDEFNQSGGQTSDSGSQRHDPAQARTARGDNRKTIHQSAYPQSEPSFVPMDAHWSSEMTPPISGRKMHAPFPPPPQSSPFPLPPPPPPPPAFPHPSYDDNHINDFMQAVQSQWSVDSRGSFRKSDYASMATPQSTYSHWSYNPNIPTADNHIAGQGSFSSLDSPAYGAVPGWAHPYGGGASIGDNSESESSLGSSDEEEISGRPRHARSLSVASPFANIGKRFKDFDRKRFLPQAIRTDAPRAHTYICPKCKTEQREFFTVTNAPRQFETASGYIAFYFGIYVIAALYIFGLQEGWPTLDCFYFAVITLTTAGLGDLVPTSDGAKILCSVFIYFGVACIGLLLGSYIAGMLDETSRREARQNRIKSCPNCARLQNIRDVAEGRTRSQSVSMSPTPFGSSAQHFPSERPLGVNLPTDSPHSENSIHNGERRDAMTRSTLWGSQRNMATPPPHSTPSLHNSDSKLNEKPSRSDRTPGSTNVVGNPNFVARPHHLGSPLTAQILGRQSHTRHASFDLHSGKFATGFPVNPSERARRFSVELPTTYEDTTATGTPNDFTTPHIPPPPAASVSQMTDFADDEKSTDYSDTSSNESGSFLDDADIEDKFSGVKNAKYVFLTLREALLNSILIIAFGCLGFYFIEGFSVVDSWYFTTVLLTTVGYGDIVPVTNGGKLFSTVYILVAGTILLNNMSMISMIPLELRKRRIEKAVLTQFGDQLDDATLRELATGPLVQRMNLHNPRPGGLDECTREMFALAMLVRLGKVTEEDVRSTFAAFRKLDVGNEGVLNSRTIITGMIMKKRQSAINGSSQNHSSQPKKNAARRNGQETSTPGYMAHWLRRSNDSSLDGSSPASVRARQYVVDSPFSMASYSTSDERSNLLAGPAPYGTYSTPNANPQGYFAR